MSDESQYDEGQSSTLSIEVSQAQLKGREVWRAVQESTYQHAEKLVDDLSDFEASLMMGQLLIFQRLIEERVMKIHGLRSV